MATYLLVLVGFNKISSLSIIALPIVSAFRWMNSN